MARILFIGDIIGRPGRKAVQAILPMWREKYKPDVVIVNVENIAHGKGVTINTIGDLKDLGIDAMTSGNHVFDKGNFSSEAFEKFPQLVRPANYPENVSGHGYYRFSRDGQQYLIVNLNGRVFFDRLFDGQVTSPFFALDKILEQQAQKGDIILVDFHAEATSEKVAFGWYADGRVTAVFGTHTHIPTADARVLPKGTAYITDVGMSGPVNSVIGVKTENSLNLFLEKGKFVMEPADEGPACVNGVLIETKDSKAISMEKLYSETAI